MHAYLLNVHSKLEMRWLLCLTHVVVHVESATIWSQVAILMRDNSSSTQSTKPYRSKRKNEVKQVMIRIINNVYSHITSVSCKRLLFEWSFSMIITRIFFLWIMFYGITCKKSQTLRFVFLHTLWRNWRNKNPVARKNHFPVLDILDTSFK